MTIIEKLWEKSRKSGKSVKLRKVIRTKGFCSWKMFYP